MDAQWLSRVAGSQAQRYLEEQHQISLWSESGANVLSLWSVLFVQSFFTAMLVLMPITLFYVPALTMPADELNPVVNLIYVILSNAIMHAAFAALAGLILRHLFGHRIAAVVAFKIYIYIFLAAVSLSIPILFKKVIRLWIQRFLIMSYFFGFGYIHKNANRLLPLAETDMHRKFLVDGTAMVVCKTVVACVLFYNGVLVVYPIYVDLMFYTQLFIRLVFMTFIFFLVDFVQIYSLINLPPEYMEKRMDIVSLVNSYARLLARLMIATVRKEDYEHNLTVMCTGVLLVDVFNRTTYNIRYHIICQLLQWWRNSDLSAKSLYSSFQGRVVSPMRKMTRRYNEEQQRPDVSRPKKKNKVQTVTVEQSNISEGSPQINVREVPEPSHEHAHLESAVIAISGPGADEESGLHSNEIPQPSIAPVQEGEEEEDAEKDPFMLPSPLREMRVKQITDNVVSEIRLSILISFFVFYLHRLFPSDLLYTPSTFVECFYLLGIQVIFEFLSDLFSFYVEIYYYKLPLDITYDDFKGVTRLNFAFLLYGIIGFQSYISFIVDFHYTVEN